MPTQQPLVGALTDGTGVSAFGLKKLVKDFIADVLLSSAAALVTVQIVSLESAAAAPTIAAFAIGGAVIRAGYRVVLRWATTDE